MADTMIERMAIALAAEYGWEWSDLPESNPIANTEHDKAMYRAMARAALAVMREPTDSMIAAGGEAMSEQRDFSSDPDRDAGYGAWQAMIDAALSEQP